MEQQNQQFNTESVNFSGLHYPNQINNAQLQTENLSSQLNITNTLNLYNQIFAQQLQQQQQSSQLQFPQIQLQQSLQPITASLSQQSVLPSTAFPQQLNAALHLVIFF